MANLPVRREGGERRRTPPEREPLGMRWDPFHQLPASLTDKEASAPFMPDFQIEEIDGGFVFKANLPGIKENEVDIAVTGNRLTISGHIYDSRACSFSGFRRAFTLPVGGTGGDRRICAALDRGVLTVQLSNSLEQAPEAATLPCDDPLQRWESEGGVIR